MSKAKKVLLLCTTYVLVAAIAIGGTLAYLTSTDSDVNVMTLGNVSIRQNEEQRVDPSKNGTLTDADIEDFEQAKPIYPYVDANLNGAMKDDYEEITFPDGNTYKLFIGDNAIDKLVSVTNTGKSDAYVRTIVALEAPTNKIDLSVASRKGWEMDKVASSHSIEVNGVKYDLFVCVYKNVLKPGETTPYSLLQIILDGTATNEDAAAYGDTYDVLVLSQAVQTAGFEDATTALNTGFGVVDADSAAKWFGGLSVPKTVASADELVKAISAGEDVVLNEDIVIADTLNITTPTKIDLNGHNLTVTVLEAKDDTTITGGTLTHGNSTYPALSVSAGTLTLNGVDVVCNVPCHVTYNPAGTLAIAEYVGLEIWSGKCVLNDSTITVNCTEKRYGNTVFGIGMHEGEFTMNGGSITVKSAGSHQARYEGQAALFTGSETEKVINLNNVTIDAKYFLEAWGGNTVINTTDAEGAWDGKCNTRYTGDYQINYNK